MKVVALCDPETDFDRLRKRVGPWSDWFDADVVDTLERLGHGVDLVHFGPDIGRTVDRLGRTTPDVVFNLVSHAIEDRGKQYYAPALLELLRIPYTGSGPRGVFLSGSKDLTQLILRRNGIETPRSVVYPGASRAQMEALGVPLLAKPLTGGGSEGLTNGSLIKDARSAWTRVRAIHQRLREPLIIEEYIHGRDFTVAAFGYPDLKVLPPWEWDHSRAAKPFTFVTERIKWNDGYRKAIGVRYRRANLSSALRSRIDRIAKKAFKLIEIEGYGALDFRVRDDGSIVVLEVNANPGLWGGYGRWSSVKFERLIGDVLAHAKRARRAQSSAAAVSSRGSPLRGFTQYRFDAVIKIGGSLLRQPKRLRRTLGEIDRLRRAGFRLLLIPGGGPTDKAIESVYSKQPFSMDIAHTACALAQDQTGLILCDRGFSQSLEACDNLDQAVAIADAGKTPLLLPSRVLFAVGPVQHTWDITSDAIAGWFAWLTDTARLAILTDVDGIYARGRVGERQALIAATRAGALVRNGQTSVDVCLPELIHSGRVLECAVLNGWHPERLREWVRGNPTVGTIIRP